MSVSIVMPCYNEEGLLEDTIRSYYGEIIDKIEDSEFIVIDDGSTDSTPDILRRLSSRYPRLKVIRHPLNRGHGQALISGYRNAAKSFVFSIDSDNCFKAAEFWRLYNIRDKAGLISGYRFKRKDPWARTAIAKLLRCINYALFGLNFKDANCPFKLIRRSELEDIMGSIPSDAAIPSVMLNILFAHRKGKPIIEVPVEHNPPLARKSYLTNLRLCGVCLLGFRDLLILRFNLKSRAHAR